MNSNIIKDLIENKELSGLPKNYLKTFRNLHSLVFNTDYKNVLKHIPDGAIDLMIVDIPYGINVGNMAYLKEVKTLTTQKNGTKLNPNKNKKPYTQKDWDKSAPNQSYFDELKRISKNQIIFGIEYVDWTDVGPGRIKWNKGVPEGMSFKGYELAYCSLIDHVAEIDLLWSGMRQAKSLKEPMVQQGNKKLNEKRHHPCHKPRLLYIKLLMDYAKEGMVIRDTHLGDGELRMACAEFNCDFIGTEIDPEYFNNHVKTWNLYNSQPKLNLFV